MSYYKQSGVSAGLIRSINQGMSARVKSGEEYANTRRNNVEFGGAADAAKLFIKTIVPKFRPMFITFSQAKLTKAIYELVKSQVNADWGERSLLATDDAAVLENLNALAKKDYSTYFGQFKSTQGDTSGRTALAVSLTSEQIDTLIGLGFDGVNFRVMTNVVCTGQFNENTGKIGKGVRLPIDTSIIEVELTAGSGYSEEVEVNAKETNTLPASLTAHRISVCVAMPYKVINEVAYTMQEWCSFAIVESQIHA